MKKPLLTMLLLVFLCGCFKTKDELAIKSDGSGTVRIETRSSIPAELAEGLNMETGMGGDMAVYPPTSEAEAHKFFPAKDFTVTTKQEKADNGDTITTIEAAFQDINALLDSPYGRAHALTLRIDGGVLVFKAVTGMEAVARLAEMKSEGEMDLGMMPGLADLQKKKDEMRDEFRVTLPNAITAANGAREGKTAIWVAERAKAKDADNYARQLGVVAEASCPADGLKFSPVMKTRLGLLPFKELAAGESADKGAAIDTNKIGAAAKFVPYGLVVTRTLDLSGDAGGRENGAQLVGAIVLPREYAPQKWGEGTLDEVVDAKGNNLKPGQSAEEQMFAMRNRFSSMGDGGDEGDSKTNGAEQRRIVTLGFKAPDWKVKEIDRIKGSVGLQYFGGSQVVVKLTNAIPANWIKDASSLMSGGGIDSSGRTISDGKLAELGVSLTLQMGMAQSGMTMLQLQVQGKQAAITEVQAFDSGGRPWPTFLQQQDAGDEGSCQVLVAGKPQPPLSLALMARSGGAVVEVPILLEHVPVAGK